MASAPRSTSTAKQTTASFMSLRRRPSNQHVSRSTRTISRKSTQTGAKRMRVGVPRNQLANLQNTKHLRDCCRGCASPRGGFSEVSVSVRKSNSCWQFRFDLLLSQSHTGHSVSSTRRRICLLAVARTGSKQNVSIITPTSDYSVQNARVQISLAHLPSRQHTHTRERVMWDWAAAVATAD